METIDISFETIAQVRQLGYSYPIFDQLYAEVIENSTLLENTENKSNIEIGLTIHNLDVSHRIIIYYLIAHYKMLSLFQQTGDLNSSITQIGPHTIVSSKGTKYLLPYQGKTIDDGIGASYHLDYLPLPLQKIIFLYLQKISGS